MISFTHSLVYNCVQHNALFAFTCHILFLKNVCARMHMGALIIRATSSQPGSQMVRPMTGSAYADGWFGPVISVVEFSYS